MIRKLTLLLTLTALTLIVGCSKQPESITPQIGSYTAQSGTLTAAMYLGVGLSPELTIYDGGRCTFQAAGTCTYSSESPDYRFSFDGIESRATFTASDRFTLQVSTGTDLLPTGLQFCKKSANEN